ncbi:acyl carrier protein 1, chloroplastic-like [Tasmannia lanceolata]|uniref:acyl carrier protein 1, chloroplastic-like n=1 Tax=Tasmannia lanceolata TaxID=3420 RepID=UPI004062E640
MATVSPTSIKFGSSLKHANQSSQVPRGICGLKLISVGALKNKGFSSLRSSHFRISCAAKAETVEKVCEIVRKQLALPPESSLTPESKFSALGADSLDTVEIVMGLEEEFGINVEEESSQNITSVQEAADLIEKLVQKKEAA